MKTCGHREVCLCGPGWERVRANECHPNRSNGWRDPEELGRGHSNQWDYDADNKNTGRQYGGTTQWPPYVDESQKRWLDQLAEQIRSINEAPTVPPPWVPQAPIEASPPAPTEPKQPPRDLTAPTERDLSDL